MTHDEKLEFIKLMLDIGNFTIGKDYSELTVFSKSSMEEYITGSKKCYVAFPPVGIEILIPSYGEIFFITNEGYTPFYEDYIDYNSKYNELTINILSIVKDNLFDNDIEDPMIFNLIYKGKIDFSIFNDVYLSALKDVNESINTFINKRKL